MMNKVIFNKFPPKIQSYCQLAGNLSPALLISPPVINYLRFKFSILKPSVKLTPSYICLVVNRRCQLTCHFCSYGKSLNNKQWRNDELTLDRCRQIFSNEYASKSLLVQLTGGEPLLNKELIEIIKYLKNSQRIVSMVSNGLLLSGEKLDLVSRAGLDMLNISIYPENFERLERLLPAICSSIFTKLSLVVTSQMLNDVAFINNVAKLANDCGARGLSLMPVHPTGWAEDDLDLIFYNNDSRYLFLQECLTKTYPDLSFHFSTPASKPELLKLKNKVCRMPWYFAIIDARGQRGICCHDTECQHGNIFSDSLEDLINSPFVVDVRRGLLPEEQLSEYCKNCYMLEDRTVSTI